MRTNRVRINLERFGKSLPKNYPTDIQKIEVFCDDYDSIHVALSKAFALAMQELEQYEKAGVRANIYTNEFSKVGPREIHGSLIDLKPKYEQDLNLEYTATNMELSKDRIWVHEHLDEIMAIIRGSDSVEEANANLKDKFDLDDYQLRKLFQMRLDMMTSQDYLEAKDHLAESKKELDNAERSLLRREHALKNLKKEKMELETYYTFVDNYEDIIKLSIEAETTSDLEQKLQDRLGLTYVQASMYKYYTLKDFSKEEQEKRRKKLERTKESIEFFEERIQEGKNGYL